MDSAVVPDFLHRIEIPVPGTTLHVTLGLSATHDILIERPAAWTVTHVAPAARYRWLGGMPAADRASAPEPGPWTADDRAWRDPVLAVAEANAQNYRVSPEIKVACTSAWENAWHALLPMLDARAHALAVQYHYAAPLYAALVARRDLCDVLTTCPALGPFMTQEAVDRIPATGVNLAQVAAMLLAEPSKTTKSVAQTASATTPAAPAPIPPGPMAWMRHLPWKPDVLPRFTQKGEARLQAERAFVRMAVRLGKSIDPNGVQKLTTEEEWLLVNLALTSMRTSMLVPGILSNPAGAIKGVATYFGDMTVRGSQRDKMLRVLTEVADWRESNPEDAARIPAFRRMTEEARRFDRAARHQDDANELARGQLRAARELARVAQEEAKRRELEDRFGTVDRINDQFAAANITWRMPRNIDVAAPFPDPPLTTQLEADGRVMIYHPTARSLATETLKMDHCVATHSPRCLKGEEWVFSVRSADDRETPIATIALNNAGEVIDNRGRRNAVLPPELAEWTRKHARQLLATRASVQRALEATAARRAARPMGAR